mmetsp:Transcript_4026/g.7736  ORF Transcript_4026/g.7736 Transcript_4026/m.7736 type:complete len:241 (-) Transcript_4026:98-820(-)|eukprot:scaffold22432_cov168-Amphora_coffeaeformis.AAC.10
MNPVGILNKLRRAGSARWGEPSPETTHSAMKRRGLKDTTITTLSSHSTIASSNDSLSTLDTGCALRVRFCTREEIHPVQNCFSMSPEEKASTWYDREELKRIKKESRHTANMIKSEFQQTLLALLRGCHDQAIFIAELGFGKEESSGVSSSLLSDLTLWASSSMESECCRGMEKTLLRRECEAFAHDARRSVVLESSLASHREGHQDAANNIADTYHLLSRHAVVFAKAMADADTAAAAQ